MDILLFVRESGESALADRPRGIFSLAKKKMITRVLLNVRSATEC